MVEYHILIEKSYNPSVPKGVVFWFEQKKNDTEGISFYRHGHDDGYSYTVQIVPGKAKKKLVVKVPKKMVAGDDVIESLLVKKWFKVLRYVAYEEGKRFVLHTNGDELETGLIGIEKILSSEREEQYSPVIREMVYTGVKTLLGVDSITYNEQDELVIHGIFKFKLPVGKTKRLSIVIVTVYTIIVPLEELSSKLSDAELDWLVKSVKSFMKKFESSNGNIGIVYSQSKIDDNLIINENIKVLTDCIIEYKLMREVCSLLVLKNVV